MVRPSPSRNGGTAFNSEICRPMVSAKRSRSIDLRVWRSGSCLNSCSMLRAMKCARAKVLRSEEHTSELQSLMRISYAVFCLKKKKYNAKYQQKKQIMREKCIYTSQLKSN